MIRPKYLMQWRPRDRVNWTGPREPSYSLFKNVSPSSTTAYGRMMGAPPPVGYNTVRGISVAAVRLQPDLYRECTIMIRILSKGTKIIIFNLQL